MLSTSFYLSFNSFVLKTILKNRLKTFLLNLVDVWDRFRRRLQTFENIEKRKSFRALHDIALAKVTYPCNHDQHALF